MNRNLVAIVFAIVLCVPTVSYAALADDVVWSGIGGLDGDWIGDINASPAYSTGGWTSPAGVPNLNSIAVFNRPQTACCPFPVGNTDRTDFQVGSGELGTDIFISNGGVVTYNPNAHVIPPNVGTTKFRDFMFNSVAAFPGHGRLTISNGSRLQMETGIGGDPDGEWTRWNGAELNLDGGTFRRTADEANGKSGGAFMVSSFAQFANSVQTITLTNGGRIENEGQLWFGQSDDHFQDFAVQTGIRVVMSINNGHLDLTGGDDYELNNDGLPLRADLAFLIQHSGVDKSVYIINFTGPGTITVDGDSATTIDGDTSLGGGGIRVATMLDSGVDAGGTGGHLGHTLTNYGTDGTTQRSYLDLWNLGILTAQTQADLAAGAPARSGLTGHVFTDYFSTTNLPGQTDYKLTSLLPSPTANGKSKGDYNNDGNVDAADYVIYRATVGSTTDLRADGDGSLHISAADLVHWRDNFGATGLPTFGSGAGSSSSVPEPGTALFAVLGLASLWLFKRR